MTERANRRNIVADILGHPEGAPSIEELAHMNPGMESEEIRQQLRTLADDGVVRVLDANAENVEDAPKEFYVLTEEGRERHADAVEAWRREYGVVEKPERIRELEQLPRPD